MKYLRQSTAGAFIAGPFLDKADGLTPKTALASQNGRAVSNGSAGAAFVPASWTHDGNGHYLAGFATTDVPTVGRIRFEWSDPTTFVPVWEDFTVLAPAVYDALFGTVALSTYAGGAVASVTAAVTLTAGERNTVADVVLTRDWTATVAAIGTIPARCALQALRALRNRWTCPKGGPFTATAEDDTTAAWTQVVTEDPTAPPVTGA